MALTSNSNFKLQRSTAEPEWPLRGSGYRIWRRDRQALRYREEGPEHWASSAMLSEIQSRCVEISKFETLENHAKSKIFRACDSVAQNFGEF